MRLGLSIIRMHAPHLPKNGFDAWKKWTVYFVSMNQMYLMDGRNQAAPNIWNMSTPFDRNATSLVRLANWALVHNQWTCLNCKCLSVSRKRFATTFAVNRADRGIWLQVYFGYKSTYAPTLQRLLMTSFISTVCLTLKPLLEWFGLQKLPNWLVDNLTCTRWSERTKRVSAHLVKLSDFVQAGRHAIVF